MIDTDELIVIREWKEVTMAFDIQTCSDNRRACKPKTKPRPKK